MNKNKFVKFAGALTALVAISSSAFACHFFTKKSQEQKDTDKKNKEKQNSLKEENEKKDYIEMKTMYGIPIEGDLNSKEDNGKSDEDIIIIEKYGIPFDPEEDKRILKYAVPKVIMPSENTVKKYAVPQNPAIAKYALPQYMNDDNIEKYAVPDIDNIPVLKYATPYIPPENTDNGQND